LFEYIWLVCSSSRFALISAEAKHFISQVTHI
jgi:hypothetical protein